MASGIDTRLRRRIVSATVQLALFVVAIVFSLEVLHYSVGGLVGVCSVAVVLDLIALWFKKS